MTTSLKNHVVNLSAEGRLHRSGQQYTPPSKVDAIFDSLEASGKKSLTIFFHGGVNGEAKGMEIAGKLYQHIDTHFDSYPIFFVWESGIVETVQSELQKISSHPLWEKIRQSLLKHTNRYLNQRLPAAENTTEMESLAAPIFDEPTPEELAELEADLLNDSEAMAELNKLRATLAFQQSGIITESGRIEENRAYETAYFSPSVLAEIAHNDTASQSETEAFGTVALWGFVTKTLKAIAGRYIKGSDHGLQATVMEEIYRNIYVSTAGSLLWTGMKSKAESAYRENPTTEPTDDFFGGSYFMQQLAAYVQRHPSLEINLIGHSAGSIHICHFLWQAQLVLPTDVQIHSVAFLAPAATIELVATKIVPLFERIKQFCVFTMDDPTERQDALVRGFSPIYPHSLLYFVSGLFEPTQIDKPLIGLARHLEQPRYAGQDHVASVRRMFEIRPNAHIIYSPSPADAAVGFRAQFKGHSSQHGPNEDAQTLQSLAFMISGQEVPIEKFASP